MQADEISIDYQPWLHGLAVLVVVAAAGLLYTGGHVTTLDAGLAVPDWPLSFGSVNPDGWWQQQDVRAEHGHRLTAGAVGLLVVLLGAWIWARDHRRELRWLAAFTVAAVVVQAVLGGLRVVDKNIYLAMVHAAFAQGLFAALVTMAWMLSRRWHATPAAAGRPSIAWWAMALAAAIYLQLIAGAVMRHRHAGMAIHTWPTVDGGLWPDQWSYGITLHYLHRVGGLVVIVAGALLWWKARRLELGRVSRAMIRTALVLVAVQVVLGGLIILSRRLIVPTTLHVVLGALTLAAGVTCAVWLGTGRDRALAS